MFLSVLFMIKKIIFIIFLFSIFTFLFLFLSDKADAADEGPWCFSRNSVFCKSLGSPPDKCCREKTCSSVCGSLDKWSYCYITGCCAKKQNCPSYIPGCYENWYWQWTKIICPVTDTCLKNEEYLHPGICDTTGCTVGGKYKACCRIEKDGTRCKCSGGENTGTCFYDNCYGPGITLTCPISAAPTPTHTVCSGTSCVTVSGSGSNECSVNADCGGGATHKVCSGTRRQSWSLPWSCRIKRLLRT